jgi:hypothetical protein
MKHGCFEITRTVRARRPFAISRQLINRLAFRGVRH